MYLFTTIQLVLFAVLAAGLGVGLGVALGSWLTDRRAVRDAEAEWTDVGVLSFDEAVAQAHGDERTTS